METIKPDTRAKDQLIKKEATWLAQRASAALALETLLASIPKLTLEAIPSAVEALLEAADQYKASNFLERVMKFRRKSKTLRLWVTSAFRKPRSAGQLTPLAYAQSLC